MNEVCLKQDKQPKSRHVSDTDRLQILRMEKSERRVTVSICMSELKNRKMQRT